MYPKIFKIVLILTITALVPRRVPAYSAPAHFAAINAPKGHQLSNPRPRRRLPPESELTVIDDGSPLPPQVVGQQPNGAEELAMDGVIRLVFDQAMDTARTGAAFQVDSQNGESVKGRGGLAR